MVNLATKETTDLVILINGKHGTNMKFETATEKESFCKGMAFVYKNLNLTDDICLANDVETVREHAIELLNSYALLTPLN